MAQDINKIRNPNFRTGKAGPTGWIIQASGDGTRWQRGAGSNDGGMTLTGMDAEGAVLCAQTLICKPGSHYRVEALVTCDTAAPDPSSGVVLMTQPTKDNEPCGPAQTTPGLRRASEPMLIRAYYENPKGVRRVEVSVGLRGVGAACIHEVRFIEILEPDEVAHVMAIPAPSQSLSPPRSVRKICICAEGAASRPIAQRLSLCVGAKNVLLLDPSKFRAATLKADALLLPDSTLPSSIRTLSALFKLAEERIVVVSLPAFAAVAGTGVAYRKISQSDDPIHATMAWANYATRGFALGDIFAFAWQEKTPGGYVQNQFRKTPAFKAFCKKHGLDVLLTSMCDQDATSDKVIALHKARPNGGLFVMDIEPAEANGSTMSEPVPAMHLLTTLLGLTDPGFGQYIVPALDEGRLREYIREMAVRYAPITVHDADVPAEEVTEQLVTIGRDEESYGLPLVPKPVILVRSHLVAGDAESVYGALLWFKQLVRMAPYECAYAHELASQFRLAWLPCVAPWRRRDGWGRSVDPPQLDMSLETDGSPVAAVIDIVSQPINAVRVVLPKVDGEYARYATWLPRLVKAFGFGKHFTFDVGEGESLTDRDAYVWRKAAPSVTVEADANAFPADLCHEVHEAGGELVRIEIPGNDADFPAHSIHRTSMAATILEHVIGLHYGLIATNRGSQPARLAGLPITRPGHTLLVDRDDPALAAAACDDLAGMQAG